MKNHVLYIVLALLCWSCGPSLDEQLESTAGYWEIAGVETADGLKKEFSISQNIDYIEIINDSTGVRKKVQPDIAGNFTTSDASENIDIQWKGNKLVFTYSTAFDTWKETILSVNRNKLVLQNENGNTYTYRRYQPITVD